MRRMVIMISVVLMGQMLGAATVYTCDFEPTTYTPGLLVGQGTPAWDETYRSAADKSGYVVTGESYGSGNQSLYLNGYNAGSNFVTLPTATVAPWFEFAFKTAFDGTNPDAYVWARSIEGAYWGNVGVAFMISANGSAYVLGYENGEGSIVNKYLGTVANNQWQTISFKHQVVEYPEESGEFVYTSFFDVYLGTELVLANFKSFSGPQYNSLKVMAFSSAASDWVSNGTWYVDDISVGDSSVFVPEPATMSLLLIGACGLIRRKK